MQQRRYRPGDVLDDYCPRERRVTDHAIVAMIDDTIRQTRCVVCDAEHEYKDGKAPPPRRRKPTSALFTQVLEGVQGAPPSRVAPQGATVDGSLGGDAVEGSDLTSVSVTDLPDVPPPASVSLASATITAAAHDESSPAAGDERPWRRQLIRAALPRPEGHQPLASRPLPEFTVRQPGSRPPQHSGHSGRRGHMQPIQAGTPGPRRFFRDAQSANGENAHGTGRRRRRGKKT